MHRLVKSKSQGGGAYRMQCRLTLVLVALFIPFATDAYGDDVSSEVSKFVVWSVSDSHVPGDLVRGNRESLAEAIRQAQGQSPGYPAFNWDIMIDAGDFSASQHPPTDEDGQMVVRQYRALSNHYREDVYQVKGNHDGDYYDLVDPKTGGWFNKWIDPLGENPGHSEVDNNRRRFPVTGDNEKYSFQAGNVLFLMLQDYNTAPGPVGRGHSFQNARGGFPAGAVTRDAFLWWRNQVLNHQDKIIVMVHHNVLRDTTTRSKHHGGEGLHNSIGGGKNGEGSGYLYYIVEEANPELFSYTSDATDFMDFLSSFREQHGKPAIDLWIGGHSHAESPIEVRDGQSLVEERAGVTFLQTSALKLCSFGSGGSLALPMSRILNFTNDSNLLEIETYVHKTRNAGRESVEWPKGIYEPATRIIQLRHHFQGPAVDQRPAPPRYDYNPVERQQARPGVAECRMGR